MGKPERQRADVLLVAAGLAPSRQKAQALIMAGNVLANGERVEKTGTRLAPGTRLQLKNPPPSYVSRGGLKLEAALQHYQLDVTGCNCIDIGASTGGFTDCLLQHGAAAVTAVDVGYGQLAWSLRNDPRVTVMERTNFRYTRPEDFPRQFDLAVIDVSFISLEIIIPPALALLQTKGRIVALIKPQFEVGKSRVGKGGVVRDAALHAEVVARISDFLQTAGLAPQAAIPSPILGPKGNREFLIFADRP